MISACCENAWPRILSNQEMEQVEDKIKIGYKLLPLTPFLTSGGDTFGDKMLLMFRVRYSEVA